MKLFRTQFRFSSFGIQISAVTLLKSYVNVNYGYWSIAADLSFAVPINLNKKYRKLYKSCITTV